MTDQDSNKKNGGAASSGRRHSFALRATLAYAALGSLWILLSDRLLDLLDLARLGVTAGQLSSAKGMLFIAVTAALLYVALRGAERRADTERVGTVSAAAGPPASTRALLGIFVVFSIALFAVGYAWSRYQADRIREAHVAELSAIADLKAQQLQNWLLERRNDAAMLANDPDFGDDLAQAISDRNVPKRNHVVSYLMSFISSHGYKSAFALDPDGKFAFGAGETPPPASLPRALAWNALRSGKVTISDLSREDRSPDSAVIIDFLAPLFVRETGAPAGAVALRYRADLFLFPLLQKWPVPGDTAETLLVRREGGEVVFLNELRHRKDTALALRFPLTQQSLPAARAIEEPGKVIDGVDYRGIPVVATSRAIEGTNWVLVAKMDAAEVRHGAPEQALLIFGLVLVMIAGAGAAIAMQWAHQRRLYEHRLRLGQLEREALAKHFDYSVKYARDIVLLLDETGKLIECNDAAVAAYGYTREELLRLDIGALRTPEARAGLADDLDKALSAEGHTFESVHRRKDGSTFPTEASARLIEIEGRRFCQTIIRNISARKAAEHRIERLNRLYATLSQTNQAIVRASSEDALFPEICRIAVEHGGLQGAAVRIVDESARILRQVAVSEGMNAAMNQLLISTDPALPEAHRPSGIAFREDRIVINNDLTAAPSASPISLGAGIRSVAALPLRRGGRPVGTFTLYAREPDFFDPEMRTLLDELATDLSFTLDNFEREKQRQTAETSLRETLSRLDTLIAASPLAIFVVDLEGRVSLCNPAAERMFGWPAEQLLGKLLPIVPEERGEEFAELRRRVAAGGQISGQLVKRRRRDGSLISVNLSIAPLRDEAGRIDGMIGLMADISPEERLEERLRENEERLRLAVDSAQVGTFDKDLRTGHEVWSPQHETLFGYAPGEFRGTPEEFERRLHPEDRAKVRAALDRALREHSNYSADYRIVLPDGSVRWIAARGGFLQDASGKPTRMLGTVLDITERKVAEQRVERLTRFYAALSQTNQAIIRSADQDALFRETCRVAVEYGQVAGALIGLADEAQGTIAPVAFSEGLRMYAGELTLSTRADVREGRGPAALAYRENRIQVVNDYFADPSTLPWRHIARRAGFKAVTAVPLRRGGKPIGVMMHYAFEPNFFDPEICALLDEMANNISFALDNLELERQRRRSEQGLLESEHKFRGLVEQSIVGIFILADGKIAYANPRAAEIAGYGAEELIGRSAPALVPPREHPALAEQIDALMSGRARSVQYTGSVIRKDGTIVDIGANAASTTYEGKPAIIGVVQDITERKHAQEQIRGYIAQLEASMLHTVEAVSVMVELRDPYTAGHERRVAEIAVAIAEEMGLPEQQRKGLQVIGTVHDIGKISLPAEILAKPTRITDIEFEIIKTHAQAGYDILKSIEFPWPVAQAILQHHERLDGSGYPNGLRGGEIILEARILAVADVVEAMASHRPYRPGLGIDAAMEEILKFRDTRYDAQVADACLRLFREKGYRLRD